MLGATYHDLNMFAEAVECLERAVQANHDADRHTEAIALRLLGNSLDGLGRLNEARERFNPALLLQRQIGDKYGEAETLRSLAKVRWQLNDPHGARESLRAALAILRALNDPQATDAQDELERFCRDDHSSDT